MGFDSVLEVESGFYCLEFVKRLFFCLEERRGFSVFECN